MPTSQRSAGRRVRPEGVVLPGSGSDELFVRATFGATLGALGVTLCCPRPAPGAEVVPGYLAALDAASDRADRRGGALLIGGISLGAQVAVRWAARRAAEGRPGPAGLLLALPAWTGRPDGAPASVAASHSADALGRDGLAATLAEVRANTPAWLGDELARAWTRHGPLLADSLRATARSEGPTEAELAGLAVPVGLVGLIDDPLHPVAVATHWRALVPRSALVTTSLAALGRDRATLGRAAALAWLRATADHNRRL